MAWEETRFQRSLPRVENGVDFGGKRCVILQNGERRVEWRAGFSVSQGGRSGYHRSTLTLSGTSEREALGFELFSGRWSREKLASARTRIAQWLRVTLDELPRLSRDRTYIWKDGG